MNELRTKLILCILVISVLSASTPKQYYAEETGAYSNQRDFLTLIEDISLLTEGGFIGYLYFGRDTCPFCLQFNELLREVYINRPNLIVYKFDTDFWRHHEDFNVVLDIFNITRVPTLLRVYDTGEFEKFGANEPAHTGSIELLSDFLAVELS